MPKKHFVSHKTTIKMKNLKTLTAAFALLISTAIFAQNTNNSGTFLVGKSSMGAKPTGSQYFNDAFTPANIKDKGVTMIKYNAYLDQIELKGATDQVTVMDAEEGVLIPTSDRRNTYEFVSYTTDENENIKGYLNLISNSPQVKIYSRLRVFLQPEVDTKSGYESYKPPMYKKANTKYFIKVKENPIVHFSKKKDLTKLFPSKEKEVGDFISKNKISLTDDEDLVKLGEFLNTL